MNLVEFNLEEAKKDPSRVVGIGYTKPKRVQFVFDRCVAVEWPCGTIEFMLGGDLNRSLRLTAHEPRKVKVAVFKEAGTSRLWARLREDNNGGMERVTDWVEIELKEVMG